jgi:hypothetical protein
MSAMKIVAGVVPPAAKGPKLKAGTIPQEKYFTFSFRYWSEAENFSLGGVDVGWYRSVIGRLNDLSKEKVARFIDDPGFQEGIRYHVVDWDRRSVPLTRADLVWLPRAIRDNEDEYPIYQFHISKAVGRIHGFWDSEFCFNVVLLDPLHNLQPSKDVGYTVRSTPRSECKYSMLKIAVDSACAASCLASGCELAKAVSGIHQATEKEQFVIIAGISFDVANHLQEVRRTKAVSISDIVEHGITYFE